MQCCRCREEMLLVEYERIEIDFCPDCGIWLDAGELELILDQAGGPSAASGLLSAPESTSSAKEDAPVRCPVCRKNMDKGAYADVPQCVVDTCPRGHGVWFDRGELGEIVKVRTEEQPQGSSSVTSFLVNLFGEKEG